MISLQLVLAAAADCTDRSETVRMVLAMTRIKPPREVTWCDGCEIAFHLTPQATRWRVRPFAAGASVMPGLELTLARLT